VTIRAKAAQGKRHCALALGARQRQIGRMYARRLSALAIGFLALWALRTQFDTLDMGLATGQKLWLMAGFFTILTNLGVAAAMLAVAKGWKISGSQAAGLVLSILVVALIYHLILADLWAPQGLAWWADQGLHSGVPLAMLVWWLTFADMRISPRDVPKWLVWPLAYAGYALIRGAATGFWPYPFLDAATLGLPRLALNITVLVALFWTLGLVLVWIASIHRRLIAA
jgi:hypothetical protein